MTETTDAVAQAREVKVREKIERVITLLLRDADMTDDQIQREMRDQHGYGLLADLDAYRAEVAAAVRAECAAKVEALEKTRPYEPHEEERVWGFNEGIEAAVAALEAQP